MFLLRKIHWFDFEFDFDFESKKLYQVILTKLHHRLDLSTTEFLKQCPPNCHSMSSCIYEMQLFILWRAPTHAFQNFDFDRII